MDNAALEFIAILVTVAGLLGWLLKQVIGYFIETSKAKDKYIETLVADNGQNVDKFTDTVNHQNTKALKVQMDVADAINGLKNEISNQNKINTTLLNILKKNGR